MKKWLLIIIGFYLVTGALLILFAKDPQSEFEVLSIKKTQSRLMVPEEMLTFDFYVSDSECFFIDSENVIDASLSDEDVEITIELASISVENTPTAYLDKLYYPCTFSFSFTEIVLSGGKLDIKDGICRLTYINEAEFELPIGDLCLYFSDVSQILHLDFTRLYAVVGEYENKEYMSGIVIGLEGFTIGDIPITRIDTGISIVYLDVSKAKPLEQAISYTKDIKELLGVDTYCPIQEYLPDNQSAFELNGSELVFFPMKYTERIIDLRRFYLEIEYEYLGQSYSFVIDDFVYYQKNPFQEVDADEVSRHIYKY